MSATAIAGVVADLRAGRIQSVSDYRVPPKLTFGGPVVDATAVWASIEEANRGVDLYAEHCVAPPWVEAQIAYTNSLGNVIVMTTLTTDGAPQRWETAEPIDWDAVRWTMLTLVYVGGHSPSRTGPVPTSGPVHVWTYAIDAAGIPLDLHWIHVAEAFPLGAWTNAQLVHLAVLNFMNCRNVELVEPVRPRAEARRLYRAGVRVSTISVFPAGTSRRAAPGMPGAGVPLTSVRGHFAKYGAEFDRKLLFGKYSGRFWHPQHARGRADRGVIEHDYKLRSD